MTDIARNFASPSNDDALLYQTTMLTSAYSASLARDIARRAEAASLPGEQFGALVDATRGGGLKRSEMWSPELGVARKLARRNNTSAAGAQFALLLASLGLEGRFRFEIEEPQELIIAGYRLVVSGGLTIQSNGFELVIRQESGHGQSTLIMSNDQGGKGWKIVDSSMAGGMVSFSARAAIDCGRPSEKYCVGVLSTMNDFTDQQMDEAEVVVLMDPNSSAFAQSASLNISRAYRLIDAVAPEFSAYVSHLLRGLALISIPNTGDVRRQSGSSLNHPGLPTCTYPGEVDWLAETIVHEASHQYMQLLQRAFPLCTDDDKKQYYSSIKGMHRGLERQLVGYHAVVNMVRFRRALIANDGETSDRLEALGRFEKYAAEMRVELRGATGFTAEGQAFVSELYDVMDRQPVRAFA